LLTGLGSDALLTFLATPLHPRATGRSPRRHFPAAPARALRSAGDAPAPPPGATLFRRPALAVSASPPAPTCGLLAPQRGAAWAPLASPSPMPHPVTRAPPAA
jgi:hypothetical protein